MVAKIYKFIMECWSWLPAAWITCITVLVCFKFGDSVLGLVDRAWRVFGK